MKLLIAVILIATIIGGFVGGEIVGRSFSIVGAVIGGAGLMAVLLGLGAYFTAQEERKKKQQLPPGMRGVFDRMFGAQSIPAQTIAWKPRPFHKNNSRDDYLNWFANVPPWSKVDAAILEILIKKFEGNPLFEVFVHTSQDQSLIGKFAQLNQIARTPAGSFAVCAKIAMILSSAAEDSRAAIAQALSSKHTSELQKHYSIATDSLEVAIAIEPNISLLYLQMATLKATLGRNEEAANFCRIGLKKIDEQKKVPFNKSNIESVRNAHTENSRIESHLRSVLERVSS